MHLGQLLWDVFFQKKLKWKFKSGGEIFREYCKEKGWPIEKYKEIPDKVDIDVDKKAKNMLQKQPRIIYEAWLAGWISKDMPHVLKVLCTAPLKTRIKRFSKRENVSIKEARKKVTYRDRITVAKHKRLYNIKDQFDKKYFDLVLNTDKLTPQKEVEKILEFLKK